MADTTDEIGELEPNAPLLRRLERLTEIGIALTAERDSALLSERILEGAKELTGADGGSLYRIIDNSLHFEIVINDSLGLSMGGTNSDTPSLAPLQLYLDDGTPNNRAVVMQAVHSGEKIHVADIAKSTEFDFSAARAFDREHAYRTRSLLAVPMRDHEDNIIGALQLINASDAGSEPRPFSETEQTLVSSLASMAASVWTQRKLIDAQKELFESLIKLVAYSIDEKSQYTGAHCSRVPHLALMISDAAIASRHPPFDEFNMTPEQQEEFRIAAWLHDCGKLTTPDWVMDKSTKLQRIFDRINLVDARFEVAKREALIDLLKTALANADQQALQKALSDHAELARQIDTDRDYIRQCNTGGEFLGDESKQRIDDIGDKYHWHDPAEEKKSVLTEEERDNLKISRGTLNDDERKIMQNHVVASRKMLDSLPWPPHLEGVPYIAGSHHERPDGQGYPQGITDTDLTLPARMLCLADVFEALTASERPYKKPCSLSQGLTILGRMKQDGHIDADLFDLFIRERIYDRYAAQYLKPEQIDAVDTAKIPGYAA